MTIEYVSRQIDGTTTTSTSASRPGNCDGLEWAEGAELKVLDLVHGLEQLSQIRLHNDAKKRELALGS